MKTSVERLQTYKESSLQIQELYGGDWSQVISVHSKHIAPRSYDLFGNIIGDTILGFHHTKDLPKLLQKEVGLSADEAQRVVADLAEFLSPVLEREAAEANAKKQELQALGSSLGTSTATTQPTPSVPTEAETKPQSVIETSAPTMPAPAQSSSEADEEFEVTHKVQPMRTMKGDMQRIHGYGAYRDQHPEEADDEPIIRSEQSATLQPKPKLADTPRLGDDS